MNFDTTSENGIVVFTAHPNFTENDLMMLLKKISVLLRSAKERSKPFAFIFDTLKMSKPPFSVAAVKGVIKWMKADKEYFRNHLICSTVVIKHQTIASICNAAFKVSKPTRPNLLTTTKEKAKVFISTVEGP